VALSATRHLRHRRACIQMVPSHGDRGNGPSPRGEQRRRAGGEGRARGNDIVDQDDRAAGDPRRCNDVEARRCPPKHLGNRQPELSPGGASKQHPVVIPELPGAGGRARQGHQRVSIRPCVRPAVRDRPPERLALSSLARIAQALERAPGDALKRPAPFELMERSGWRQDDVPSCWGSSSQPFLERASAIAAERRARSVAPGTGHGQGELDRATRGGADGVSKTHKDRHVGLGHSA
jgi:hypothetical protein